MRPRVLVLWTGSVVFFAQCSFGAPSSTPWTTPGTPLFQKAVACSQKMLAIGSSTDSSGTERQIVSVTSDGVRWETGYAPSLPRGRLYEFACSHERFYALSDYPFRILESTDGFHWKKSQNSLLQEPSLRNFQGWWFVKFKDFLFLTNPEKTLLTKDGEHWEQVEKRGWLAATPDLIVGSFGDVSRDGIHWQNVDSREFRGGTLSLFEEESGHFHVCFRFWMGEEVPVIETWFDSTDGSNWKKAEAFGVAGGELSQVDRKIFWENYQKCDLRVLENGKFEPKQRPVNRAQCTSVSFLKFKGVYYSFHWTDYGASPDGLSWRVPKPVFTIRSGG